MKVYVTYERENFNEMQLEKLESLCEVIFIEKFLPLDEMPYLNDESEKILLVDPDWYNWDVSGEHLSKIKNLKAVCVDTTAFDWIDLDYCKANGIIVTHIPKYSTNSVAEYALFYMMMLAKKMPMQMKMNFKMEYNKSTLTTEIFGKTVGIIGLGAIGSRIAELCEALGMNVMYWSRSPKDNKYNRVEIDEIFEKADFIIPTFATNTETKKIITDERINKMENQAFINVINNAKEIYNHELMLQRAAEGKIGYAFEKYDDKTICEYKGNVVTTASYSFYTEEAIDRLLTVWVNNVEALLNDKPENVV